MSPETPPKRMTSKLEGPAGQSQSPALPEFSCPSRTLPRAAPMTADTPTCPEAQPTFLPGSPLLLGPQARHPQPLSLSRGDPEPPVAAGRQCQTLGPRPVRQARGHASSKGQLFRALCSAFDDPKRHLETAG